MILLGMTGPIGHGKTTFANALAELVPKTEHLESSLVIAEIVDAMHSVLREVPDPYSVESLNNWLRSLPAILLERFQIHTTFDTLQLEQDAIERHPIEYQKLILHVENLKRQPTLIKQSISKENKETYRPMLQWLGGYLVQKVDPGIWYKEIVKRARSSQDKGCELCIVGGLRFPTDAAILRQAGGQIIKVYRPGYLQNDMLDPTERERENIQVDSTIMSNGSIEDVKRCAATFLEDIRSKSLKTLYQTKDF